MAADHAAWGQGGEVRTEAVPSRRRKVEKMEEVRQKFRETIEQFHMLRQGDRVVAAVSGGADSVCLLALLCGQRRELGIEVRAIHVHHGLRGAEADRDAEFVRQLCGRLQVPFLLRQVDVRSFARTEKLSEEEAGRLLRYRAFEEYAQAWEREMEAGGAAPRERLPGRPPGGAGMGRSGASMDRSGPGMGRSGASMGRSGPEPAGVKIAVAHQVDDQAETILHNLCRGSGLKGLGGMRPVRGRIIRPLIGLSREEILEWLTGQGLTFCEDSTNHTDHYTRNRIRRQLMPMLVEQVNPKAAENILRMGRLAAQADDYLSAQAREWAEKYVGGQEGRALIPAEEFSSLPEILRSYVVFRVMAGVSGRARDLTSGHVDQVLRLFRQPAGRSQDLPYGIRAVREYEGVVLHRPEAPPRRPQARAVFRCFSYKKGTEIPKNQYTKWFDCGKIKGTPVVRSRQTGDYITLADGKTKTIRRFMIDEKIPREERDSIQLLADGSHILWIVGYRISEYYKIGPDTVQVLEVRMESSAREDSDSETIKEDENGGKDHGR